MKRFFKKVMSVYNHNFTSRRIVVHPLVKGMPNVILDFKKAIDNPQRLSIARRLIKAYSVAKKSEGSTALHLPKNDLWTGLVEKEFAPLLGILKSEDATGLAKFLLYFGEKYTWFGGVTLSVDGFNYNKKASLVALSYLDKLVCLAESLGVLPLENPEQLGRWGKNIYVDVNEIIDGIEREIGIALLPPYGSVPVTGIDTKRGPLHYRHINSLYAALRVRSLIPDQGSICEYGGGLGLVAYYANALGCPNYTIFDLPLINLFAGNFLIHTLGADAVRLFGEESQTAKVQVLPYWECMNVHDGAYSLALNQDSFPEIDPTLVFAYLRQIKRTTTMYFLSMNQEGQASMGSRSQNAVPDLLRGFPDFQRVYRMKYWVREGYVEELYKLYGK